MVPSIQRDHSELVDLLADLTGAALEAVADLYDAAAAVPPPRDAALVRPEIIPELQRAFRTLTHCVFLIRETTGRLRTIASASPPDTGLE